MKEITQARIDGLKEKERKLQEKRGKQREEKERLSQEIGRLGFWTTDCEMQRALDQLSSDAQRVQALKAQIKFRKVVLQQAYDNKVVFQWSAGGRVFT